MKTEPSSIEDPVQHIQDLHLPHTRFASLSSSVKSILRSEKLDHHSTKSNKKLRFNPIGRVKYIFFKKSFKINLDEPTRCKKKRSIIKNSFKLNRSSKRCSSQKFIPIQADPYLVDSIDSPEQIPDPQVIVPNVKRSNLKLATNTDDSILDTSKKSYVSPSKLTL